jgi:hypothetical protein
MIADLLREEVRLGLAAVFCPGRPGQLLFSYQ